MINQRFRELIVWQQAMDLVQAVYGATEGFPRAEEFGLKSQVRRAAISIPSNIAEGTGRGTKKDFLSFLRIAKGSARELETQIEIAKRLSYIPPDEAEALQLSLNSVGILLNRLMTSSAD